ncbi:MAG: DUF362 domain-containing protein [Myxococcota bacterium]|nr:DUF362 domain-containing protein [Myxococcota bacterium]
MKSELRNKNIKHNKSYYFNPSSSNTFKRNLKYLEERFGKNLFNSEHIHHLQDIEKCPYTHAMRHLIESERSVRIIEKKLDHSFRLTKRILGRYLPGINRRNFLKAAGIFMASATLPFISCTKSAEDILDTQADDLNTVYYKSGARGGIVTARSGEKEDIVTAKSGERKKLITLAKSKYYSNEEPIVAMVRGSSVETDVYRAIQVAGGLDEIQHGDSVMIKPNGVMFMENLLDAGNRSGTCTNPEVIRAVIRAVKAKNKAPEKICIAERSAVLSSTLNMLMLTGIYDVAIEEGVTVMPWDDEEYVSWTAENAHYLPAVRIPKSVFAFDHFINVPVLKNHEMIPGVPALQDPNEQAEFTNCIKTFVGVCKDDDRNHHQVKLHSEHFPEKVAELNLSRPHVTMNVVDATKIILTNGPVFPTMEFATPGIVLASKDRVACDAVSVAILKYYAGLQNIDRNYVHKSVWEQRQIIHAGRIGLGVNNPDQIHILHTGIDEISDILNLWRA